LHESDYQHTKIFQITEKNAGVPQVKLKNIVKMDMNKEKWINEVMSSLDNVKSAEADPFLYNRIISRLEKGAASQAPARLVWIAAASFAVLVFVNIYALKTQNKSSNSAGRSDVETLADAYQLNNSNSFSYQ
jgi:hypothetical protein